MTDHDSRTPLRLVLVTGGKTIPNWLFRCLEAVEQSGAAKVVLVWQAAQEAERASWRFVQQVRRLFFWLYQNIDRNLFRRYTDALTPIDLPSALRRCRVLTRSDLPPALVHSQANSTVAHRLHAEQSDIVLDPFSLLPDRSCAEVSRYGVWNIAFGQSGDPRTQSAPAFWEVVEGRPSTETRLCIHYSGFDNQRALYVSVAPTDRRSVSRSQNHVYWKISAALAAEIQRLWEDPDGFLERLRAAAPFEVATTPSLAPSNLATLLAGTHLVRRYLSEKWVATLYREHWALAYRHGMGDPLTSGGFHQLMPPVDRYWADPFPIQVGNAYYVFHEEVLFSTDKGSIVLTVLEDNAAVGRPIPILERDYHLSYPFVFQWDGDVFMIPETASHHQVQLYRCVSFPLQWKLERVLLSGLMAYDPTLAFISGRWWLFANVCAYGAGTNDVLHVFHADSPVGPWTPHRNNPIKSDVRSARPAGRIFERDGQFYRPAQDCSRRYGYAVSINRILQLDPETYEEVEVDKIIPRWGPQVIGVHTFNQAGTLTVIDCLVRRRRFWPSVASRPQLAQCLGGPGTP